MSEQPGFVARVAIRDHDTSVAENFRQEPLRRGMPESRKVGMRLLRGVRGAWPLVVLCGFSPQARADAQPSAPIWRAPAECPQEPIFVAQLEHFLGQRLDARRDQGLEISGDVSASETGGYVARLRVRGASGTHERELSHRDCAELTEAAALVTALAIDPSLAIPDEAAAAKSIADEPVANVVTEPAKPPETPATPAPAAPAALPAPTPLKDVAPERRPGPPLHAGVVVVGLAGNAVLPDAGLGLGARARVVRSRFGLALQADYWLPRTRSIGGTEASVQLGAWDVGLKACGVPIAGHVALSLCAGGVLGDMYGSGNERLSKPRTSHRRWSALEAELDLMVLASSGVATWLGVEGGKTLEAPNFGISMDGQEVEVFTPSGWIVSGFVGLGVFR
jgi:hypothetical protein